MVWLAEPRSAAKDDRVRASEGVRSWRHHVSHQGLGNFATAVLGNAHSNRILLKLRHPASTGERSARSVAPRGEDYGDGQVAARSRPIVYECSVSGLRRDGAPGE